MRVLPFEKSLSNNSPNEGSAGISAGSSQKNVFSVVLCGGSGTRLWPLSRRSKPKQFLALGGAQDTLLSATLSRVERISPKSNRWIVTAKGQEHLCAEQAGSGVDKILVEPAARNTAAAIAWAAWELKNADPNSYMIVLSSDHSIQNVRSFEQTVSDALLLAEQGYLVTVGIQPTYPSTGFGYIEFGLPLDAKAQILAPNRLNETPQDAIGYSVRSFREKPNLAAAEQFLRTGKYLWNAAVANAAGGPLPSRVPRPARKARHTHYVHHARNCHRGYIAAPAPL